MYGEKQIISPSGINLPNDENKQNLQTNGIPNTSVPPFELKDCSVEAKKKIKTDILDLASPFVSFGALLAIISFVFYTVGFGVTGAYLSFLAFTTFYIVTKQKEFPLKAVFPLCLCIITALCYSLHFIDTFSTIIPFLFYLSGLYCMNLTKTKGSGFSGYLSIYNQIKACIFLPIAKLFLPLISLWQNRKIFKVKKGTVGVLIGILCGIPVFIIVAKLLTEGDAAFSGIMNGFITKISDLIDKFFEKADYSMDPLTVIIALIFTPWVVSTIFAFRHGVIKERLEKNRTEETVKGLRFVSVGVMGGFYGVIAACYLLYLVSQFSYLFGAFSGDIPLGVNISLSEYARRGFFEISTVAFINLCLIGAGAILSKRDEKDKLPKLYKAFSLFFCLFTILLIITAMSKMGLYITELGLTQKRIIVFVADIILIVTFVCILIKIFKNSFPYMKITMYTALVLITIYFVVSPEAMIGRYNTWAYLSGHHKSIDMYTIKYLDNYEAAMAFDKLTQSENEVISATAKNELYNIYDMHLYDIENGTFSDLSSQKLVKFLKENKERIKSYDKYSFYDVYYEYDVDKLTALTVQNGGLIEIKKVNVTFSLNTEKEIDGLYISNNYCGQVLDDFGGMKSLTFEWKYSTSNDEIFADVEIEDDGQIYHKKILFSDYSEYANQKNATYITKDTFNFELRDDENGEFVIVEK